jgi:hypothetical protein
VDFPELVGFVELLEFVKFPQFLGFVWLMRFFGFLEEAQEISETILMCPNVFGGYFSTT